MFIDTITGKSRPPWADVCNKTPHATTFGVGRGFYVVSINIRPPSGSILLDEKLSLGFQLSLVAAFVGMTISVLGIGRFPPARE